MRDITQGQALLSTQALLTLQLLTLVVLYKDMPIDGVRVETETGWFVARPSGTEDLYKIYGESYKGDKGLVALLTAGEAIVTAALSDEV